MPMSSVAEWFPQCVDESGVLTLAPLVHDPDHGTDRAHRGRSCGSPRDALRCQVPNLTAADTEPVSAKDLRLIRPREERTGEVVLGG